MRHETYAPRINGVDGKLVERREATFPDTNWTVFDGQDVKIGEEPLTEAELETLASEGQPTPTETRISDIEAATDLESLKAALVTGLRED